MSGGKFVVGAVPSRFPKNGNHVLICLLISPFFVVLLLAWLLAGATFAHGPVAWCPVLVLRQFLERNLEWKEAIVHTEPGRV